MVPEFVPAAFGVRGTRLRQRPRGGLAAGETRATAGETAHHQRTLRHGRCLAWLRPRGGWVVDEFCFNTVYPFNHEN
jgi:hypothetical protein